MKGDNSIIYSRPCRILKYSSFFNDSKPLKNVQYTKHNQLFDNVNIYFASILSIKTCFPLHSDSNARKASGRSLRQAAACQKPHVLYLQLTYIFIGNYMGCFRRDFKSSQILPRRFHLKLSLSFKRFQHHIYSCLRQDIPPMVFKAEKLIFVALCNDLIDYFIVCFEHQCNTMRAL